MDFVGADKVVLKYVRLRLEQRQRVVVAGDGLNW